MLKKFFIFSFYVAIFIFLICSFYHVDCKVITTNYKSFVTPINKINNEINSVTKSDILAHVKIPKINVDEDIYKVSSSSNNVNKHVTILKESILPNDDKNSIIFLAANSGSGSLAYFKNLDKLQNSDNVIFTYNNVIYTYQVVDIFEEEKDGDIEISKSNSEQLILTTCSPHSDDKQLIVDTILINEKRVN